MADLKGRTIAFLEARRTDDLASLITRHNGVPLAAPCLVEVHRPDAPELAEAVDRLCGDDVQIAIFMTGVGTNTFFEAARLHAREQELLDALARKQIVVRGPKPTAVLRTAGVRIDLTAPEPNTSRELLAALQAWDLNSKTVAIQLYGGPNPDFSAALAQRGAHVIEIQPYAWGRPSNPEPILRLVDALQADRVDALLGTSAAQVDNLFAVAREHGREDTLRAGLQSVPLAAQGPVCAAAFQRNGLRVSITPEHVHMGSLVLATAAYFDQQPHADHTAPVGTSAAR